ncbi:mucin-5AC [Drosophila montana]|uniref:mucin-5AC n=1 Tax=Drosophila montana TaxID=40370 RepID=UPI00313E5DEF
MYKTIRHGENSLQYTILPQNDDFRIEGKLTNASCLAATTSASTSNTSATSCTSGSGAKRSSSAAPRRRRTFFAYLGLIFVCTVIIGAVLIPFLVSAECLPSPAEWFLKTKAAFTHSASGGERQLPHIAAGKGATAAAPAPPVAAMLGQNVGKTVQIVNHNGIEQFVLKLDKTQPATTTTTTTTTTAATTTTTTPSMQTTEQQLPASTVRSALPATYSTLATVATSTAAVAAAAAAVPPLSNRLAATITTRIIQVPLLKSAAKKPIMPPVLAKTQSTQLQQQLQQQQQQQQQTQQQQSQEEEQQQNRSNIAWMNTRWAYIDPSTYVQWSGYKAEDSVLLPALLGFALIGMILIITVCLVARNKRTIVSSVRKRNRNDIEEQGAEDNATLLTTTNLSDDD